MVTISVQQIFGSTEEALIHVATAIPSLADSATV
jgi:hypothetical protein